MTEANICREFVTPKLVEAGWGAAESVIGEQHSVTNGRAAEGNVLYWPIRNLDIKNPNARAGLEHADPKDLIASMLGHEADVMRLLGEIEALVNEVQA